MEMSEAAGMRRLAKNELDPVRRDDLRVGEMILNAAKRGAEKIIIGLAAARRMTAASGCKKTWLQFFGENDEEITAVLDLAALQTNRKAEEPYCFRQPLRG